MGILFPSLTKTKALASSLNCKNNLKQWGYSTLLYVQDNGNSFPGGYVSYSNTRYWFDYIAEYISNNSIYIGSEIFYKNRGLEQGLHRCPVKTAFSPRASISNPQSDYSANCDLYFTNIDLNGTRDADYSYYGYSAKKINILKDASNTFLLTDGKKGYNNVILRYYDLDYSIGRIDYRHLNSNNSVFADGHVFSIPWNSVYNNIAHKNNTLWQ
jgi:prepilin-type processing-associated H-X9-DG protein